MRVLAFRKRLYKYNIMRWKMAQYENEFSNFPKKLITKHNYKNVDEISAPLINQINTLRSQGFYAQAAQILQNNK